ncbi:uncharacterized protein RCC_05006 [Ramularia collo-cygni]|uniref:Enoyl reductase (ER) domain-containing protein n=1 Tax=Ramularia collo-cygni TaxID=112498 RepID=A0A2D3V102_9PEZI|nr:uncharacterized protein RCC_05006 [Ramularia collo-cygni]CZT19160.1 uncharacterized protein RCC_05006 [Ramularia collo-cygni]
MVSAEVKTACAGNTQSSVVLSPDHVLMTLEHFAPNLGGSKSVQSSVVFSGYVVETGSTVSAVRAGERTLVFGKPSSFQQHPEATQDMILVPSERVHAIPKTLSNLAACSYAGALVTATMILSAKLHMTFLPSSRRPLQGRDIPQPQGARIAIVGGETDLAAALIQLLRRTNHDIRIVVTATMGSQIDLFQRVCHLVSLGASFGIDGALPDLLDHAEGLKDEAGIEVIINTTDKPIRADLLGCLKGPKKTVECQVLDRDPALLDSLVGDAAYRESFYALLAESAEIFARYIEPPDRCVPEEDKNVLR